MRVFLIKIDCAAGARYRARKQTAFYDARELSKTTDGVVEVSDVGVRSDFSKALLVEELLNGGNWGTGSSEVVGRFQKGKQIKLETAN